MRIFYSFLIIFVSAILILLPVSAGVYDFKTDLREDSFTVITPVATTNATVQLFKPIYDDDTSTIELLSHEVTDVPLWHSYNATTRALVIIGLTANVSRTVDVTYDVEAFDTASLVTFLNYLPWIWIIIWVALPLCALLYIWGEKLKLR